MALKTRETILHFRKGLVSTYKIINKSVRGHPFVWGFAFLLLILHRCHPYLFGFVVSSSPVIVCTTLLLGTLLIYGDANIPETEREQNIEGFRNIETCDNNVFNDEFLADTHIARKSTYSAEGSDSDHAESSSPDASVSDIIPMLDELHPLLDSDAPMLAIRSADDSDVASTENSHSQESDDGSLDEEIENQEDEDEAQEKDDANEEVLKWTADDQKNLMDLGTSELERNQRLENLIAKRRARKFLSFHGEKNLIDLDISDPLPSTDDHSCFNFQLPSISAPRRNPFDIPFEEETMGLPPLPGSAPTIMQPSQNPFDIPYDQEEENGGLIKLVTNQQQFVPSQQRQMLFQGHERFAIGTSAGDTNQHPHDHVLKPYFVGDRMNSEGLGCTAFHGESSKNVASKISSTHESDTTSSDMDHEDQKELVEPELQQGSHLHSIANHIEHVEGGSQSSEEVDSIEAPHEQIGIDAVEMEIGQGDYILPDSDGGNLEVIDERYDGSSSSSSEVDEKHSKMSDGSSHLEHEKDNNLTYSDNSVRSVYDESDVNKLNEMADDSQIVDPVYDSSPSAVDQSHSSGSAFDAALLPEDVQENFTEESSSQRPHGNKIISEKRSFESNNGCAWVAASSLSFVDENESKSREINEIKEQDVIRVDVAGSSEDLGPPVSPVLSKLMLPIRFSFKGGLPSDNMVERDASDNNGSSIRSNLPTKPLTPRDVVLQTDRVGLSRHFTSSSDLPSILEENSD